MKDSQSQKSCLFGGALIGAGLVAVAMTDSVAQCSPVITDTIISEPYLVGAPYTSNPGFRSSTIAGDRLYAHVNNYHYDFGSSYDHADVLLTFDISDPTNAVLIGSYDQPPGTQNSLMGEMAGAIGDTLISRFGRIHLMADPNNPVFGASQLNLGGSIDGVEVANGLIYALTPQSGWVLRLDIIDVSDPFSPVMLGSLDIPDTGNNETLGRPTSQYIPIHRRALSAPNDDLIMIVDISDPTNPVELNETQITFNGDVPAVIVEQTMVLSNGASLLAFDISDPTTPVPLPTFNPAIGNIVPMYASGQFVVGRDGVFDYSNPAAPVQVGTVPGGARFDIDEQLYMTMSASTINIVDLSPCGLLPEFLSVTPGGATDEGGAPIQISVTEANAHLFQWSHDGMPIVDGPLYSGATSKTLTVSSDLDAVGLYTVEVGNAFSTDSGGTAIVGVRPDPNACDGDINGDGMLNFFDVQQFIIDFQRGCP